MNKFKKIYCGASFVFACIVIVFTITLSFANPVTTYAASSKSGKSTQSDNRDVADALGLSTATVSKVIHGKTEKISDETVKSVQQELENSGYISNMAGILLARNNSRIIGVVVNDHEKYEGRVLEDGFVKLIMKN